MFDVVERGFEILHTRGKFGLQMNHAGPDLDAGFQFLLIKGLGDVVVRAGFEALDDVRLPAPDGEQDHVERGELELMARAAAQLYAVHAGHLPVNDGEARGIFDLEGLDGLLAVGGAYHLVLPAGQQVFQDPADYWVIFDDQDFYAVGRARDFQEGTGASSCEAESFGLRWRFLPLQRAR